MVTRKETPGEPYTGEAGKQERGRPSSPSDFKVQASERQEDEHIDISPSETAVNSIDSDLENRVGESELEEDVETEAESDFSECGRNLDKQAKRKTKHKGKKKDKGLEYTDDQRPPEVATEDETGQEDTRPPAEQFDNQSIQSIQSDTAAHASRKHDDEDSRTVRTNSRRIPLERKVHWPSERTMENQFDTKTGHYRRVPAPTSKPRLSDDDEEERVTRENSNRARREAREAVLAEESGSGSETALSSSSSSSASTSYQRTPRGSFSSRAFNGADSGTNRQRKLGNNSGKAHGVRAGWHEEKDLGEGPMREDDREGVRRRRARQFSFDSDDQDDESEDEAVRTGRAGILSSFLGLSRRDAKLKKEDDADEMEKGEKSGPRRSKSKVRDLPRRGRDGLKSIKKRRRWSHQALFRRDSTSSIGSMKSNFSLSDIFGSESDHDSTEGAGNLESEAQAREEGQGEVATGENPNDPQVQQTGRSGSKQNSRGQRSINEEELYEPHLLGPVNTTHSARSSLKSVKMSTETDHHRKRREMKEDLNTPYIPSTRVDKADAVNPNLRLEAAQGWVATLERFKAFCRGDDHDEPEESTPHRSIAALIIATQGLAGVASPRLARIAPASGKEAETNRGSRKISEYSNPREQYHDRIKEIAEEFGAEAKEKGTKLTKKQKGKVMERAVRKADLAKAQRPMRGKRNQKEIKISRHPSKILERQDFVVSLAKALINFGAPTHSVESWLEATSDFLEVDASFIYLPSILILTLRDEKSRSSDVLLLRPTGSLDLYRLSLVHKVYRLVVHDVISVNSGARALRRILKETRSYHWTILMLSGFLASACGSIVAFSGSFVDGLMSGAVGLILNGTLVGVLGRHKVMSNIFELTAAGLIAFVARGLGGTEYFCYSSIVSSAIIIILPGWAICLGALELGSRNVAAGAIRVVFAIVYTLFLSFAISIGTQIMDATGVQQPAAPSDSTQDGTLISSQTVMGSFTSNNTAFDNMFQNGTFTFQNGTSSASSGQVTCYRSPELTAWWYLAPPDWSLFITVPIFAAALATWFRQDWKSRDMVVSIMVASLGYLVQYWVKPQFPDRSDITSAVQAFTVGVLGNMYSRIGRGSAFPSMVVGILLAVPNAVAAAGGISLASDSSGSSDSGQEELSSTVIVAIRMVQTAIGLAIGLFAAAVVVYPFGKRGYIFAF